MIRIVPIVLLLCAPVIAAPPSTTGPSKVAFDPDGIITVSGQRFFPIAIWLYELNVPVMADLHEHRFNTVIGNGFGADQFDFLRDHGMMAVPFSTPEFITKVKDHPSLLAWYLVDEPEGAGNHTPEALKQAYDHLRAKDANHPIGVCNFLFEAIAKFKEGCDFTMTDVYPILANRDGIIGNVGVFVDEARRVHGPNWPHWCHIQIFGGPDTDGGKWSQPLPHEVRCMTFDALVHRATGILYFSYWPKAQLTWASVGELNRELEGIVPWILAKDGTEMSAKSSDPAIHVRARRVGDGWMILAVNVGRKFVDAAITVDGLGHADVREPKSGRDFRATGGTIVDRLAPFDAKAWFVGPEPR